MEVPGITACAVGERAVLVEAQGWAPVAFAAALRAAAAALLEDVVPGAATVLAVARQADDLAALRVIIEGLPAVPLEDGAPPRDLAAAGVVEIPVSYDGADLEMVARAAGLSVAEVVAAHQAATYQAAFCGFAPGFAYLSGLPERLWLPRRSSPRTAVPAGSVAIADRYSAVYPAASPGGWHLLGRTEETVWDLRRRPPALLSPGTRVRFVAGRGRGYGGQNGARRPAQPTEGPDQATIEGPDQATESPARISQCALHVLEPGLLTTVQDGGRPGLADQGVPPSGWLDGAAARLANRLVGNDEAAAVLEVTVRGPALLLHGPAGSSRAVAVTGADAPVTIDGLPAPTNAAVEVPAGSRVDIGPVTAGVRAYLAVAGGLDLPPVLGSQSTDVLSGLGPPPLATGQRLPLGPDRGRRSAVDVAPVATAPAEPTLRVVPGPRADWLAPGSLDLLTGTAWTVGPDSNRIGLRLSGAVLQRSRGGELAPEGLVAGALQIPPSGAPVLFLADHPVTGGYPVLAVVVDADLHLATQLQPGASLRFALAKVAPRAP